MGADYIWAALDVIGVLGFKKKGPFAETKIRQLTKIDEAAPL